MIDDDAFIAEYYYENIKALDCTFNFQIVLRNFEYTMF